MELMMILLVIFICSGLLFLAGLEMTPVVQEKTGVIVVDIQGDFTSWKNGTLAVPGTDRAFVEEIENATRQLAEKGFLIFGTQDWHPVNHVSFYCNHFKKQPFETIKIDGRTQLLWPSHCVQGTENAEILVDNNLFLAIVRKGQNPKYDSYSGFQDDGGIRTEMNQILKQNGIEKIIMYGIATDYCVKETAVDAIDAGYKVIVVEGLSRGVAPETTERAVQEMKQKGITVVRELREVL